LTHIADVPAPHRASSQYTLVTCGKRVFEFVEMLPIRDLDRHRTCNADQPLGSEST